MRKRVAEAMYEVWGNRCRELHRNVQFGAGSEITRGQHWIVFAHVEAGSLVGLWHIKMINGDEYRVIRDDHYSPARPISAVREVYRMIYNANVQRLSVLPMCSHRMHELETADE